MSEQGHSDQETGEGVTDPNTPDSSSLTATPPEQNDPKPKSPDEDPQGEAREGGTPTHAKGSVEEDEDEDN